MRIFINYRREDCLATAGRLHDRLAAEFGVKNIFMDVDHIPAGADFTAHLQQQIAACDAVLALIGPGWLAVRDAQGRQRIGIEGDFVRTEIAAALARNVRLIPVLVDGARMPSPDELPGDIKALSRRNAVEVRNTQFGSDAQRLIERINASRPRPRFASTLKRAALGIAALAGVAALAAFGLVWSRKAAPPPVAAPAATVAEFTPPRISSPPTIGAPRSTHEINRIRLRQAVIIRISDDAWQWIEKDPRDDREVIFSFQRQSISPDEILLYDGSRDMYARLNLTDRRAYWRVGTTDAWKWNYDIVGVE